ncbi:MAG: histidine kinase [Acidobacteriota bacterium]
MLLKRWRLVLLVVLALVAFAAFFATVMVALDPFGYGDGPVGWTMPFVVNFFFLAVWAALVPLVVRLSRRLPMGGGAWKRSLPIQLGLSLLLSMAHLAVVELLVYAFNVRRPGEYGQLSVWSTIQFSIAFNLEASMAMYWTMAGLAYAWEFYTNLQEKTLSLARQETQLERARLQALESQLAPHFLFNTLNTISALVDHDAAASRRMIARLGDLLRYSLQSQERAEVRLEEEVEVTARYLEIERARYAERLQVTTRIPSSALACAVPALVLQPLVENCVRHGVTRSMAPLHLELAARVSGDVLEITVSDDGPGADAEQLRAGVGLANVRARLHHLYGDNQSLTIETSPGRGFAVKIALPARSLAGEAVA